MPIVMRTACPECQKRGGDTSCDNLAVYDDGGRHCHACGYHENQSVGVKVEEKKIRSFSADKFNKLPVGQHPIKPYLSRETLDYFNVKLSSNPFNGSLENINYPYYDTRSNRLIAEKVKKLDGYVANGQINKCGLFGQQLVPSRGKMLTIVEGEDDALGYHELMASIGKERYSVVSLINGADEFGKLDKATLAQYEFLSSFEMVVICFDNDTPGESTANALADKLCQKVKVKIVPVQYGKDMCELIEACNGDSTMVQKAAKDYLQTMWNTAYYEPEDVIDSKNITYEDIIRTPVVGIPLPWPILQSKLGGLRGGEVTILAAGPGIGKSTICRAIAYALRSIYQTSIANIFLEDGHLKAEQAYIAIDNGIPLHIFRANPNILTREQIEASMQKLFWGGGMFFHKHWGSIESNKLTGKLEYYASVHKCQLAILDHISIVTSGRESNNERKDIDMLMTETVKVCVSTGLHVLAVVHINRGDKKSTSPNEGGRITLRDLRGSSALEGLAANVIVAERDQQASGPSKDVTTLRLLKNREVGLLGICDSLCYDHNTGLMIPINVGGV